LLGRHAIPPNLQGTALSLPSKSRRDVEVFARRVDAALNAGGTAVLHCRGREQAHLPLKALGSIRGAISKAILCITKTQKGNINTKQMCQDDVIVVCFFVLFACLCCLALIGRSAPLASFSLLFFGVCGMVFGGASFFVFFFGFCRCFSPLHPSFFPSLFIFKKQATTLCIVPRSLFLSVSLFGLGNTIASRRNKENRKENPKYIHILSHTHVMGPKKLLVLLSLYASLLSVFSFPPPSLPPSSLPSSTQSYIIPVLVYSENG
jgi:hypothetical protein